MRMNFNRIGCDGLVYDGVNLSDTFEVVDVSIPVLPTLSANTQELSQRPGSYFSSRKVGTRTIRVTLRLNAESRDPMEIYRAWSMVSGVFKADRPKPLKLSDDRYVYALPDGDTYIENQAYYGVVEIAFVCYDPFFYGREHTLNLSNGSNNVSVKGSEPAYPVFDLTATGGTATVRNMETGDSVTVRNLSVGSVVRIDMEAQTAKVGNVYTPVELSSNFFPVEGDARISLSNANGSMTYRERYL